MAFFKVNKDLEEKLGYVYIMEFKFHELTLYKVGVTKNEPIDRMLQIARSYFMKHRYVPECRLVRFRKHKDYYNKESQLHKLLNKYNHRFDTQHDGYKEFFNIGIDKLLDVYETVCPS